jgi:HK97 family phage prohead protease
VCSSDLFTDLGFFREKIKAGAFDDALANKDDVRCLKNHDPNLILGRTKSGTLRLESNSVGLRFNVDIPVVPFMVTAIFYSLKVKISLPRQSILYYTLSLYIRILLYPASRRNVIN